MKHLARLIDDLLDVSRITRGKISLRKEPLDLSPVVSSAVEAVRPLLEERKHELSVSLVNGGLRLDADPLRLEQILVNLLTNAAKYTDAGGRICAHGPARGGGHRHPGPGHGHRHPARAAAPHLRPLRPGGPDDGPLRGRAGDRPDAGPEARRDARRGVTAASEGPGQGSEFTVRLPALEEPAARKPGPTGTLPRVARQGSRVLVVDDNLDTAAGSRGS